MKKKALRKDFYMEIKKSLNRFLSIVLIVALGVAFYSGIQSAAPDMRFSGDAYFDEHRLMDLKVIGTLGLTEDDVEALSSIDGISKAEPGYMTDVLCGKETQKVLHLESISPTLNQITALEGRLPEKSGECFVDIEFMNAAGYRVGEEITFYREEEDDLILKQDTFTIVGAGSSPLYISFSRGNTTLGSGELDGVGYILPEDFDSDVYTQIYMEVRGARNLTAYTDAYDTLIERVMKRVENIEGARCEARYEEVMSEAESELADAEQELADGKTEGESELADAREELLDGEKELVDGKKELADARKELADGRREILDGEKELEENRSLIEDNEQILADSRAQLADGLSQLQSGKAELEANEKKFDKEYRSGMAEITQGERELADAKAELEEGRKEYLDGLEQYNEGKTQYEEGEIEYAKGLAEYEQQLAAWPEQKKELETQRSGLATAAQQWENLLNQQAQVQAGRDQGQAQLDALNGQLQTAQQAVDTITAQQAELQNAVSVLPQQIAGVQAAAGETTAAIASKAAEIENANAQIASLNGQLEEAQRQETPDEALIAKLNADLSAANENLAALTAQKSALEGEQSELNGQAAALQGQLDAANTALAELPGQLAQAQGAVQQLSAGATKIQGELAKADAGLAQIQGGIDTIIEQLGDPEQLGTLEQVNASISAIDAGIVQAESEFDSGRIQLTQSREQLDAAKQKLEETLPQLQKAQAEIEEGEKTIAENEQRLIDGRTQLEEGKQQLEDAKKTVAQNEQKLADGQSQLEDGERQLADAKQKITDAEQELADGKKEYREGKLEIAEAEKELADGKTELEEGREEYRDGKKEYMEEIADAEQKLADARQDVADIKMPEWMIDDRSVLPENIGYGENAARMKSLGQVFPVLFFLVAALISLTTMTRMVEEERTQIGTLKALGYGKLSIASKYLCYALAATLSGSVIGILVGEKFLPFVIVTAYKIMYHHMPNLVIPYNMKFALIATGAALFSTMAGTLSACYKELAATPAILMRPPAPKEGKRVLLEYIPILWKHLSFSWKSTVRNLFRYKKRFFMTIFGISGCMALMLVGYGLRDSIMDIANLQFKALQIYDGMVILDDEAKEADKEALVEEIREEPSMERSVRTLMRNDTVQNGKKIWDIYLMVPENVEEFENFVAFRDRETDETYELTDEGAIITEKIANMMDVGVGDTIAVMNDDYGTVEIPIAAITENYLNHYLYLTPELYRECYGEDPAFDAVLYRVKEGEEDKVTSLGEQFLTDDAALSISYTASIMSQVDDMLSALDSVMIVLIVSAGLLAFVVLYNLNNININERKRELATIKVLGFYDLEVSAYVYRENILLTIIGIFAGVGLGIVLHRFTITTVEVDACMFGRNINLPSFLTAAAFTAGFSIFVNVVMHFKLRKIDMVESLKSVE